MKIFINTLLAINSLILLLAIYLKIHNELTSIFFIAISYICFLGFYIVTLKKKNNTNNN